VKPVYVHDAIRKHLNRSIRPPTKPRPPLEELRQTEWIPEFEQYMRNRLVMGAIRYETFKEKIADNKYDCIGYVKKKLDDYKQTGNLECLVDAANLLMIEFASPTIPNTHFTPLDDVAHVQIR